jgi:hypothetical protein
LFFDAAATTVWTLVAQEVEEEMEEEGVDEVV